ncbi:MAG: hypoxanthine phosphoribosyltransferase [Mycoplasmoidaceae bacterium]
MNQNSNNNEIESILITNKEINIGIKKAAKWVDTEYCDEKEPILILCVLKGSIPFLTNLMFNIKHEIILDCICISSYIDDQRSLEPKILSNYSMDVIDKNVLIVDDIIDSGFTSEILINMLNKNGAKSVKLITLLDKKSARVNNLNANYSCFNIPNKFVVGYGLDWKEKYRNLNYIAAIKIDKEK